MSRPKSNDANTDVDTQERTTRATSPPTTRRQFLTGTAAFALVSTASIASIAGCLGTETNTPTITGDAITDLPAPRAGANTAPITVTVYSDYSCSHCHSFRDDVFPVLMREYIEPGDVQYHHGDYPIPVDNWSVPAAMAARAVQHAAGHEAYWWYADSLYANQGDLSYDRLADLADGLDADVTGDAIVDVTKKARTWPVVAADRATAKDHDIKGTPAVVIGDEHIKFNDGEPWAVTVTNAIDDRL
jgi:protein-disulfide isomerase